MFLMSLLIPFLFFNLYVFRRPGLCWQLMVIYQAKHWLKSLPAVWGKKGFFLLLLYVYFVFLSSMSQNVVYLSG